MDPNELEFQNSLIYSRAPLRDREDITDQKRAALLKIINRQHARESLDADQVYIFPATLSDQTIDLYGTRMAPDSLRNYLADVKAGIALMNSHRTGGFFTEGELPLGRWFDGRLEGQAIRPKKATKKRVPDPFDDDSGQALNIYGYLIRGIQLTDIANDDIIRGIDGGTISDTSITFSTHPNGMLKCSICGRNYRRRYGPDSEELCSHVAFIEYEEGRCFVWVEGANAYEGSLVWKGANPGALIRKAQEAAEAGELPAYEVERLENIYQVRLLAGSTFGELKTIPGKKTDDGAGPDALADRDPEPVEPTESNLPQEVNLMDRNQLIALMAAVLCDDDLEALQAIDDDLEFLEAAARQLVKELNVAGDTQAELETEIEQLKPMAAVGTARRDELVELAVTSRVRAQGDDFDAKKYRAFLANMTDLEFLASEAETWQARAAEVLDSDPKLRKPADETPAPRAPAGAYR